MTISLVVFTRATLC